jgi:hypothetical protein
VTAVAHAHPSLHPRSPLGSHHRQAHRDRIVLRCRQDCSYWQWSLQRVVTPHPCLIQDVSARRDWTSASLIAQPCLCNVRSVRVLHSLTTRFEAAEQALAFMDALRKQGMGCDHAKVRETSPVFSHDGARYIILYRSVRSAEFRFVGRLADRVQSPRGSIL